MFVLEDLTNGLYYKHRDNKGHREMGDKERVDRESSPRKERERESEREREFVCEGGGCGWVLHI